MDRNTVRSLTRRLTRVNHLVSSLNEDIHVSEDKSPDKSIYIITNKTTGLILDKNIINDEDEARKKAQNLANKLNTDIEILVYELKTNKN